MDMPVAIKFVSLLAWQSWHVKIAALSVQHSEHVRVQSNRFSQGIGCIFGDPKNGYRVNW